MSFVLVHDATTANFGHLPPGQVAGYDTGPGIAWTAKQWAARPGAVHIDQDWQAGDAHSDVLDVESGAATPAECARWYKAALASIKANARPGQRHPMIYTSAANVTNVANALIAGGVRSGPYLWVANWSLTDPQAVAVVTAASGPYPIEAVQFTDGTGLYDSSIFSSSYLGAPPAPPGGPYLHEMDGHHSLNDLAAGRHTSALSLWDYSLAHYSEHELGVLFGLKLPRGWRVYTRNP